MSLNGIDMLSACVSPLCDNIRDVQRECMKTDSPSARKQATTSPASLELAFPERMIEVIQAITLVSRLEVHGCQSSSFTCNSCNRAPQAFFSGIDEQLMTLLRGEPLGLS